PNASKDKTSSSTDGINWEEMISESDVLARSGGSSIPTVSSTSKLSADLGVTPEEFKQMHKTKPDEALAMLLQARGSSSSTASGSSANVKAKHDALIYKFAQEFIREDVLEKLKDNPKDVYGMKAFLAELQ
ncbi:protein gar2-like, partial [Trifolium medium]|nr:protein gar2-like [Trifolium medium]